LAPDTRRYTALAASPESGITAVLDFDGTPVKQRWHPITVEPILGEFPDLMRVGDLTKLGAVPVFSDRAVKALERELGENGELLPLTAPTLETPYYVYNVTTVVDALDRSSTIAEWLDADRLLAVERYGFRAGPLGGATIFKIPELRRSTVFVTDLFVGRAREANLEGFAPEVVWSE
jgi:hypothetical protein